MKKILKNNILFLIMFLVIIVLSITIGVVANTTSNKNMEFNVSVQYTPIYDVEVYMLIDLQDGIASEDDPSIKIFDSSAPNNVNSDYIASISKDTLQLSSTNLALINNEYDVTKHVHFKFTTGGDKRLTAILNCGERETNSNFKLGTNSFQSISTGLTTNETAPNLGALKINLKFELAKTTLTVTYGGDGLSYEDATMHCVCDDGSGNFSVDSVVTDSKFCYSENKYTPKPTFNFSQGPLIGVSDTNNTTIITYTIPNDVIGKKVAIYSTNANCYSNVIYITDYKDITANVQEYYCHDAYNNFRLGCIVFIIEDSMNITINTESFRGEAA